MLSEKITPAETVGAGMIARSNAHEGMEVSGRYTCECVRDGKVIWREEFDNLVTTVGKNSLLDKFLDLGSAHSAIHMGLKGSGSAAAGDTMASHSGWTEPSIVAARLVPAFSAASSGSKATSAAVSFSINSGTNTVVAGVFIVMSGTSAVANTTGTLYSAGDFASTKTVSSGDTLNVTYTASA
ncbi:MAG: hypothetical protein ACJ8ED_02415 [Xanthobacteraceae bacterium]